jgi:CHAT domain-containing protein/tetratricopeptide (TPR) repeat protein
MTRWIAGLALGVQLGLIGAGCKDSRAPPVTSSSQNDLDSVVAAAESIYMRGEFDSARTIWREALSRATAGRDSVREARVLTWLGLAAYRQGDYREARSLGERALAVKLETALPGELTRSYNALGLLAWNEGRLEEASQLFEKAFETARAAGDETAVAKAANNMALVHTELGNFAAARAGFGEARRAAEQLGDARIEGGALTNLGMLEVQLGDPASAIAYLHRARERYRAIGYATGEQNTLGQLGTAYDALGEPQLALAAVDSALALSREQGLRQEEASNLELIAGFHRQAGDLHRALRQYQEANRLNNQLGLEVEKGTNLRSAAEIHLALGRADLAETDAVAALQIHQATGARLQELRDRLLIADLASRVRRASDAARQLRVAERLATALDARTARIEVALARAMIADRGGNPRAALRALEGAREDLERGGYGSEWQAAELRARAYVQLSLLDSAAQAGREAVAAVERIRGQFGSSYLRSSFAVDKAGPYAALVDVLLRLGRSAEAFEVADASRSRALLEHLAATSDDKRPVSQTLGALSEGEVLLRQIDNLVTRLEALEETPSAERDSVARAQGASLAAELMETRTEYEALLVRTSERDAGGAALLGVRRTSVEEVQRALQPGEALIEYFVAPARLIVFVVTRESLRTHSTESAREDLTRRVRLVRDVLGRRVHAAGPEAAELLANLHSELIAPLEDAGWLHGVSQLVIVPHGALAYLPFAALRRESSAEYLAANYALVYLPSAAALTALRGRVKPVDETRTAATVFAPFPKALPASEREAQLFRRAVRRAGLFVGRRATEARFRQALARRGVVHVASHGVMNPRNPMFSRIELARGRNGSADDGRAEVHELLGLRVASKLVFLSGCETGVGPAWSTGFARGEDYATLAQALLYAGARHVVSTFWRINDDGAAAFAERFYARLATVGPSEAVAAVQRDLLRVPRYSSPYYWAAYQVSGGEFRGSPASTRLTSAVGAHPRPRVRTTETSFLREFR